jgi:hypothetical protein
MNPDLDPEHWYIYIILPRLEVIKKSQNSRNQGYSYYFCLMMEGSGAGSELVTKLALKHTYPDPLHFF